MSRSMPKTPVELGEWKMPWGRPILELQGDLHWSSPVELNGSLCLWCIEDFRERDAWLEKLIIQLMAEVNVEQPRLHRVCLLELARGTGQDTLPWLVITCLSPRFDLLKVYPNSGVSTVLEARTNNVQQYAFNLFHTINIYSGCRLDQCFLRSSDCCFTILLLLILSMTIPL